MGRTIVASLITLIALSATAHAEDVVGTYALSGSDGVVTYTGTVRIFRAKGRLAFSVERDSGVTEQGHMRRRDGRWEFRSDLRRARGLARSLNLEAAGPLQVLSGSYAQSAAGNLSGRWRISQGRTTVASGTERLIRHRNDDASTPNGPAVRVAISVDWEGRSVERHNVEAMKALRAALPGIPLTHFLNAAYFTKPAAIPAQLVARMKRVVLDGDERGLHIHGWRSLIDSAGVLFKTTPSYWGENRPLHPANGDVGHEVEIAAYSVSELRAIVRWSQTLLAEHGFPVGSAFRAGGWLATPEVLHAVRAEGLTVDSSSTDVTWHNELRGRRLHKRIFEVWPHVTRHSQPFTITTPAGEILEMPDTGALADYVTAREMEEHLRDALGRLRSNPTRDVFVHLGFHQETAARYASRISEAIQAILADGETKLVFETISASANAARALEIPSGPSQFSAGLPLPTLRQIPEHAE